LEGLAERHAADGEISRQVQLDEALTRCQRPGRDAFHDRIGDLVGQAPRFDQRETRRRASAARCPRFLRSDYHRLDPSLSSTLLDCIQSYLPPTRFLRTMARSREPTIGSKAMWKGTARLAGLALVAAALIYAPVASAQTAVLEAGKSKKIDEIKKR